MFKHYLATIIHKGWVMVFIVNFCGKLIYRGIIHDFSKFYGIEAKLFSKHLHRLKDTPFGSPEYEKMLEDLQPALDHHYKNNSHHIQHYKNGIHDFSLLDFVEFYCDTLAAVKRQATGNVDRSIDICEKRFYLDRQLSEILHNQVKEDHLAPEESENEIKPKK